MDPMHYPETSPAERHNGGRGFTIAGFVMAVISLLIIPPLFGILGIIFGIVGHSKGDSLGKWAAIAAGVCMVAGMIIGAVLLTATN